MRHAYERYVRTGLALGLAATLAACAGSDLALWNKGGANSSSTELARTKEQCTSTSQDYGFTTLDSDGGSWIRSGSRGGSNASARRQADLHRLCMNDWGYTKDQPEDDAESVE